jgi:S-adenosylmethionine:tRNA-ribosyltransferase-isomerase (queuine synthetase)
MIVDRRAQSWRESVLRELPELLAPGDLIVANDTRVFPARCSARGFRRWRGGMPAADARR